MARGKGLSDPAVREKAKATIKANARKNAAKKLLAKFQELDLAPIDEEIADLRRQVSALERMREQLAMLRGQSHPQPVTQPTTAAAQPTLRVRVRQYLEASGPTKEHTIAADLGVTAGDVVSVLRGDACFERSALGWKLAD